jgi:AGZA family xanthine/uracil permease-like MFS transporter
MPAPSPRAIKYWAEGDVNATVGLLLDNLTSLVILAALLTGPLGFGREIVFTRMIPGTALGVLVGDLLYFWLALRVARRTGRDDVTAMPLGVDTPSLFGLTLCCSSRSSAGAGGSSGCRGRSWPWG